MAKNDDDLPQIFDLPQLQIVEVEAPVVDRIRELSDLLNRTNPPATPEPKSSDKCRWN
jgi:hypothetical protein